MSHSTVKSCCVPSGEAGAGHSPHEGCRGHEGHRADEGHHALHGHHAHEGGSAPSSQAGLVALPGGTFMMGGDDQDGFPADGEGPAREVRIGAFRIAPAAVTNREFGDFVRATQYVTDAERTGASFVFYLQVAETVRDAIRRVPAGLPWWLPVDAACWQRPEGPGSHIHDRLDHPVVHMSWFDAQAYCAWTGTRLPTEAQWEYAARGGLHGRKYPWGDELQPDGRPRCNIWRGDFPGKPAPGWRPGTMPVTAFEPNGHGLYNMAGNVWEWCEDWFTPGYHTETAAADPVHLHPTGRRSMRGGSFLCHASYCNRYRVAARNSNTPGSTSGNCGFRVVAV